MSRTISFGNIAVNAQLHAFVTQEAMPGTGIVQADFWQGLAALVQRLAPLNEMLLRRRDELQAQIDAWHRAQRGAAFDAPSYRAYLREIGYLQPQPAPFAIDTAGVDPEIALIAGPQLVVPVNNSRYALNAANARWGSLYDALYGTDVISGDGAEAQGTQYNPRRGELVIDYVRKFLDEFFPLHSGSHREAQGYRLGAQGLEILQPNGSSSGLRAADQFIGYRGEPEAPSTLLLEHHGLHVEIHIDRAHPIGRGDAAGISDVVLESAMSTIQDFEDSVAAVDVEEKVGVYRNWLGLMTGTLSAAFDKGGRQFVRRLNPDRRYRSLGGSEVVLHGRSLLLARNVGSHMLSDAITLDGRPIAETMIDAVITALIAMHDLRRPGELRNSRSGSVYIVKPKMHGAEEVALADRLFAEVEDLLGLARYTLKIGIMDEERRTTVNLAACIHAARHRVVFINTGFLDRTGDEIHTSMEAGVMPRKGDLKKARWLDAYERQNVDIGLACGLRGRAQIGKGM